MNEILRRLFTLTRPFQAWYVPCRVVLISKIFIILIFSSCDYYVIRTFFSLLIMDRDSGS